MSRHRINKTDEVWMSQALGLARQGIGLTRPNPPVGAVLVKGGKVVGTGYHHGAGKPHAEIEALHQAGVAAKGATLYVTLEPCSTHGRTPPCVAAVMEAGIKRVVVGAADPNPAHSGRGLRTLRKAGIPVRTGICSAEARELIAPFFSLVTRGRPLLTLKLAMSLDGRIADRQQKSQWISSPASRKRVQELRRTADGILVGINTVLHDDPGLDPRPSRGRRPFRVVLDTHARIPLNAKMLKQGAPVILVTGRNAPARKCIALEKLGVQLVQVPWTKTGLRLTTALRELGKGGLMHVVCEGGGQLAGQLVKQGLVDEYRFFLAPMVLGDQAAAAFPGTDWLLGRQPHLIFKEVNQLGPDVEIIAVPDQSRNS